MSTVIHPSALVSPQARIGSNVRIGPFVVIEDDVEIGDGTEIMASAYVANGARIGSECRLFPGAVIGMEPQDLKYKNEPTTAVIGDRTTVREYATINRGTTATGTTIVGSDCLLMAYIHIAHDCRVGNHVIISNASQLGGHVELGNWVTLGGVIKVHQFCRIGDQCMVGADTKIVKDVPPYVLIDGNPAHISGVNKVGLRRRGFSEELIQSISNFYKTLLFSGLNTTSGLAKVEAKDHIPSEIRDAITFVRASTRGIYRA